MDELNAKQAAAALGINVSTLYSWLSQSDTGDFEIRGRPVTIDYFQGGRHGQGRIRIATHEIERLREAMRVRPRPRWRRRFPKYAPHFPGITVPLGRPDGND